MVLPILLDCLAHLGATPDGAREFRDYGGHRLLLRLLEDDDTCAQVESLLESGFGAACMAGRCPFPTLTSEVVDDEEVRCRPILKYDLLSLSPKNQGVASARSTAQLLC
jgi:hypothetical protein